MCEKKVKQLAEYLEIEPGEIQVYKSYHDDEKYYEYRTPDGTYLVMDEEEAREAVYDYVDEIIDEMGIESFTPEFQEWIIDNAVENSEWFEDACLESYEAYAQDIEYEDDEKYGNRLIQECIENELIKASEVKNGLYTGIEDLYKLLSAYLFESTKEDYNGNFYTWYRDNFGKDCLQSLIKQGVLNFNYKQIADELILWDSGFGNTLSSWDGKQITLADYYAFKQNDYDEREENEE